MDTGFKAPTPTTPTTTRNATQTTPASSKLTTARLPLTSGLPITAIASLLPSAYPNTKNDSVLNKSGTNILRFSVSDFQYGYPRYPASDMSPVCLVR
ncbi:MAG: hypothetical protein II975_01700 [Bacteroidales bacterium]|nr:hypothetical protein [Bacteroidales bacterium]